MFTRSLDLSHNRDAAKKAMHRCRLNDKQPTSSAVNPCGPKPAEIILVPTELRKPDYNFSGSSRFF